MRVVVFIFLFIFTALLNSVESTGKWLYDDNKNYYLVDDNNQIVKHCSTRPSVVTGYPELYDDLGHQYEVNFEGEAIPQGTVRWIYVKDNTVEVDFQDGSTFDHFTTSLSPTDISTWMQPDHRNRQGYYVFIRVSVPEDKHAETCRLKQVKPHGIANPQTSIPKGATLRFENRRFKAKNFQPFPLTDFCASPSDIAMHIPTDSIYVLVTGGTIYRSDLKLVPPPTNSQGSTSEVADSSSGC